MYYNNYWNDEEERRKYLPSNRQNLTTRELLSGMLEGKMPITRNSYDVSRGKSPYYYADKDMNETDHSIWDTPSQTTNNYTGNTSTYGTGSSNNNIYNTSAFNNRPDANSNPNNYTGGTNYQQQNQPLNSQPTAQPQNNTFNNILQKGEQLTSAALNGLSLGFNDEIEGAISGLGYGAANVGMRALNKLGFNVRKPQEDAWSAMRRGYIEGRDARRESLNRGREDMPLASAAIETLSSLASNPAGKLFSAAKSAPLGLRAARRACGELANGIAYGIGDTDENSLSEYGKNIGLNTIETVAGGYAGNKLFGRGYTQPLKREATSAAIGKGVNAIYNGVSSYFNNDDDEEEKKKWWLQHYF